MTDDNSSKRYRSPGGSAHMTESDATSLEINLLGAISALSVKMDLVISSLREDFEKKLNDLSESVNIRLAQAAELQSNNLCFEVKKLESFVGDNLGKLTCDSKHVSIESRIDKLERDENLNVLLVNGLPLLKDERIPDLLDSLCTAIDYRRDIKSSISSAFRLPPKPNQPSSSSSTQPSKDRGTPLMFIRFYSFDDKQHFFNCYLKSKLNLTHFGFKTAARVYVNEKLTKKNHEILRTALVLKKNGSITNYHTFRGLVFVRVLENGRSVCINNKLQFETLIQNNSME